MSLEFDLECVAVTEFGVGLNHGDSPTFVTIPVDGDVQDALLDMARCTWANMEKAEEGPAPYQVGDGHGGTEYLLVGENSYADCSIRQLHTAGRLEECLNALNAPERIFCYFARFEDDRDRKLTAMRSAVQFKGMLRPRKVHLVSDALKLVDKPIFKLDADFDLLIDDARTHIWRPISFEYMCNLKKQILGAVATNVASIQRDLPFVDLAGVEQYAATHVRAAGYLASIRTHNLTGIRRESVLGLCKDTGVEVGESNGRIFVRPGHVMGFLEVLDRRRYKVELAAGRPEQFKAGRRRRIDN